MSTATSSKASESEARLGREIRSRMVKQLTETFVQAEALFVVNFSGLPVGDLEALRQSLADVSAKLKVIKRSLGRRALEGADRSDLWSDDFEGSVAVGITSADPAAVSKVLVKFAKDHEALVVKTAFVEGQTLAVQQIQALASLPSRETLLAKAVGGMQAPISGFVGVLHGLTNQLVYVLEAIRREKDKK